MIIKLDREFNSQGLFNNMGSEISAPVVDSETNSQAVINNVGSEVSSQGIDNIMEQITAFLNQPLFELVGKTFTTFDLLLVPVVVIVGWMLIKAIIAIITSRLSAKKVDVNVIHLVRRMANIVGIAILVITVLGMLHVPLTAFAFVSGALAIGVGFGAQNIINNYISGWILMGERPINVGDFLEVEGAKGYVEEIGTRSTRVKRVDGARLVIPNGSLLENTVVNWFLDDKNKRTNVRVGVAYGSPVKLVSELMIQAMKEQPEVVEGSDQTVLFDSFGDNALEFDGFLWVDLSHHRDLRVIRSNVRFRIHELFEENGITIAYPQRDIHINGELKLNK